MSNETDVLNATAVTFAVEFSNEFPSYTILERAKRFRSTLLDMGYDVATMEEITNDCN